MLFPPFLDIVSCYITEPSSAGAKPGRPVLVVRVCGCHRVFSFTQQRFLACFLASRYFGKKRTDTKINSYPQCVTRRVFCRAWIDDWGTGTEEGVGCFHFKWSSRGNLTGIWATLEGRDEGALQPRGKTLQAEGLLVLNPRQKSTSLVKGTCPFPLEESLNTLHRNNDCVPTIPRCLLFLAASNWGAFFTMLEVKMSSTKSFTTFKGILEFDLKWGKLSVLEMGSPLRCL